MATFSKIGLGARFARKGPDQTFENIAEISSLSPPQMTRGTADATHNASPDGYREFISGLRDAGEVSLEMNYLTSDPTQAYLRADINSGFGVTPSLVLNFATQTYLIAETPVVPVYRVIFPDNSMVEFEGYVSSLAPSVQVGDKMTQTVGLKVTGKPTWSFA